MYPLNNHGECLVNRGAVSDSMRRRNSLPFLHSKLSLTWRCLIFIAMLQLLHLRFAIGFVPLTAGIVKESRSRHGKKFAIHFLPDIAIATTTETAFSIDNIRQYVPLGVSVLIIIDILLGSPIANGLLNKVRPTATNTTNESLKNDDTNSRQKQYNNQQPSKERIDSQKVAQDAIQRARYTMELRSFLDAQRDPVVELQRKMDQQEAVLEQNQKKLQAEMQRFKNE